jgi:ATP-dependent Clp protease ATP-binding subunit ClpC
MAEFSKIAYYDLQWEALKGRLGPIVGRREEFLRLSRVLSRRLNNNCLIVGASGIGKTALVYGWARQVLQKKDNAFKHILQLDAESFQSLNSPAGVPLQRYKEALQSLPPCVLLIDNFGQLIYNKPVILNYLILLLKPLLEDGKIRIILSLDNREFKWLSEQQPTFVNFFEAVNLKSQPANEQLDILKQAAKKFESETKIAAGEQVLKLILQLAEKFAVLGQSPKAGINLLDESIALALVEKTGPVTEQQIYRVAADKTGIPLGQLRVDQKELLKNLENQMTKTIIGQRIPINQLVTIITRAKLGLKNPGRPLGSFLVLGPSGVGKTETARVLAEKVFGKKESFIRIDMSEFGESHTVARLIGAPAGYVGFESGGGLTNSVRQEPYSLILLDEIEKANPKIFDIFLQILEDGRLTSGQGETVDFTQTIIMATSNLAVPEIIAGAKNGADIQSEAFFQKHIAPVLAKAFRLEFLNRFDAILVFSPLTAENLMNIAELEIKKIESRVAKYNIKFSIDPAVLSKKILELADPRFGARPVKRFVEGVCETLISKKLLS